MKLNNIKLIGILVALVAVYGIIQLTGGKKKSKSLRSELVEIDTAKVTSINVESSVGLVELNKEGSKWNLKLESGKVVPATNSSIQSTLGALLTIKPSRMATKSEAKWKDYQVDSTGTRVIVKEGGQTTLDMVIGRFGMEGQRAYHTFVRLYEDKEVYVANNFMSFSVSAEASSYRDKILARINKDSLLNVTFNYPADSSLQLNKSGNLWTADGQATDSTNVAKYISGLNYITGSNFVDDQQGLIFPTMSATFQFVNQNTITIDGYQQNSSWVFHSSENEIGYFSDDSLLAKVFKGMSEFAAKE
ncbi:MAG: hypothetical protein ACJA2S_004324 [Cyclobacteriaceae bacterium]|jgi:hypothetical protein